MLDICTHTENQLEQLDLIISLKKQAVQLQLKGVSSGAELMNSHESFDLLHGMDEAP